MRQVLVVLLVAVPLMALAAVVGSVSRPRLRTLPVPPADIEARWTQTKSWRPDPAAGDNAALADALAPSTDTGLVEPDVDAIIDWYEAGGTIPPIGCPLIRSLERDSATFDAATLLPLAGPLLARDRTDVVHALAEQLMAYDLGAASVGLALTEAAIRSGHPPEARPSPDLVFRALAHEAECADRLFESAPLAEADPWVRWHFAAPIERSLVRWYFAELLHTLHPIRSDSNAVGRALQAHAAEARTLEGTLVAGPLVVASLRTSLDVVHALRRTRLQKE